MNRTSLALLAPIRTHGTAGDAPALRAYAANDMVAHATRVLATGIAATLDRRR